MFDSGGFDRGAILAIGAHPDDIELGCGGSLLQLSAQGFAVRAVVFSRGRRGALSDEDRARESALAFSKIGIDDVHIYDFPDTRLWQNLNELIGVLEVHVAEFRPFRAYTMFQHDRHQDHRVVYEATAVACRNVPQLLGYETPSSYPHFHPTVFQEIAAELDSKVAALKCHASQGARVYMQEHNVRAAAGFRGAQIGVGPAEGFMAYKMVI